MDKLLIPYQAIIRGWLKNNVIKKYETIKTRHGVVAKVIEQTENINSRKLKYQALVSALKQLEAPEKVIKKYSDKSTALAKENDKLAGENKLHKQREKHYKTFEEIEKIRDELMKKEDRTFDDEMAMLVLAFSTYIPPRRSEIADTKICAKEDDGNCLVKTKKGYRWILQKFKTVRTHGVYKVDLPPELNEIVKASLKKIPREYLLSNARDKSKPMGYASLWKLLFSYLGKGQGVDCLRSAYASHHINDYTYNEIEKMAHDMSTSAKMLMTSYRKIESDVERSDGDNSDD
jgi:hypothetical protein